MAEGAISERRARQHEAVVLKLEALLVDVRRLAARAPEGAVRDALRAAAQGLLMDAQSFGVRGHQQRLVERARLRSVGQSSKEGLRLAERARADRSARAGRTQQRLAERAVWDPSAGARNAFETLPVAPPTLGALAVELGQARARLEAFELAHSSWSAQHKGFVWRTLPDPLPILRLKPELAAEYADGKKQGDQMRKELLRRFQARLEESYEKGYADGQTGRAPAAETP